MNKRKLIVRSTIALGIAGLTCLAIQAIPNALDIEVSSANGTLNALASSSTSDFADNVQDGQILQCFCWSYKEIMDYLPKIAAQGFTAIQTSPVQVCKEQTVDDGKGNGRVAKDMWWAYYQPAAFTVDDTGDNALGTPQEFAQMVSTAHKYGVKVLVDVVANHLGNQWVADSLCERAYYYEWEIAGMSKPYSQGGYIPYTGKYWAYGSNSAVPKGSANASDTPEINTYYYANTMKFHPYSIQNNDEAGNITQGNIGMMDLDTSSPVVQDAVADYLEELIAYGVDGFRFDAAKHIETPYDKISSNFWPTVINRAKKAASAKGQDLYCYGEILNRQGIGRKLSWYTNCGVNITDSGMGHNIVENGGSGFSNFNYADDENYENYRTKMVTWAESHDNYMGTQDTHNKSEDVINKSYAILGARKDFCTLYCARFENYDKSVLGDVACLNGWSYSCVGAINKFHNHFAKSNAYENCFMSNNYTCVERHNGSKSSNNGMVIVGNSGSCTVSCSYLANGTYTDTVTGNKFTVSNGRISGTVGKSGIAVVYNGSTQVASPSISASLESGTINSSSLSVTYTYKNVSSVSVKVNGKAVSTNNSSTTVNVSNIAEGETVSVAITVKGNDGSTISKTYTYTRNKSLGSCNLYFSNTKNWSKVYAYCWNDTTGTKNASWPGVQLTTTAKDAKGNTCYVCDFNMDLYDHVIFTNGTYQTVDIKVNGSKEYTPSSSSYYTYGVSESTFEAYQEQSNTTSEVKTIYFKNDKNWSSVRAYVWNDSTQKAYSSWPGTQMKAVGKDKDGCMAYSIDIDVAKYDRIIFNNGNSGSGNQTSNLQLKTSTNGFIYNGSSYTFEAYQEQSNQTENKITLYFANTNNWSKVYYYVWNSSSYKAEASWPGTQIQTIGTDTNGYKVYSVTVDVSQYNRIIFNNGGSSQTKDLTLSSSTTGYTASGAAYTYKQGSGNSNTGSSTQTNTITLYFANNAKWTNVYVYLWNSKTYAQASSWPGIKMTLVGTDSKGYKVYAVTVDVTKYDRVIFSNGNGTQTVDLEVSSTTTGYIGKSYQSGKLVCSSYSPK